MRSATVIASAILHAVIAVVLIRAAQVKKRRAPTAISVVSQPKKKAEPKPADRPKPKPAAPKPAVAAASPHPIAAAPAPVATAPAPIQTAIEMGNEDDGVAVSPPKSVAPAVEKPKLLAAARKQEDVAPSKAAPAEECTEEPTKPVVLARPTDIEYTERARADGIEGRLVLQITVGADGSVTDVKVIKSVEPALDAAAVAAVQTWRFKPALRCGKPVDGGVYTVAQRFELGD